MITGVALVASAGSVFAADAAATSTTAGAATAVQELVVTGSRIKQPNLTSVSPLTTVTAADVKLTGASNVEALLNSLPQAFAAQTSQVSNGSDGTAQANLRNLGAQRTLVLVDGRRLMPGSVTAVTPNLNDIPAGLVDRVEVVTGGASAVYGSDAVAGVVNFILKKNFEGVQVDYQYGFFNHQQGNADAQQALTAKGYPIPRDVGNDGGTHNVSLIVGASSPDNKGNITAYATYRHLDPILQGTRDFSDCGIATVGATNNQHSCSGSSNNAYGWFGGLADNPDGSKTFIKYNGKLAYNFNPLNFLQREDETYTAGYFAHYEINKNAEVYSDFMFADDQTRAQIAPSGLFRNSGPNLSTGYTFNCNNPLLSASQAAALCPGSVITPGAPGGDTIVKKSIGYRFIKSPRVSDFRHTDYKIDVGLRGDIGDGWSYDASLQYGTSLTNTRITGYGSTSHIQNALNVINDPVTGKPVCVIGGSCVPLDIFVAQSKNITQAASDYALSPALTEGQISQQVANININGDLGHYGLKSPWAADGVGVAFGAEYRRDFLTVTYDAAQHSGDLSGAGGQALDTRGAVNVKDIYGEIRVPLVHGLPFFEDLAIGAGYRSSHYNLAGDTSTYKVDGTWSPVADMRFRASYNHAVRAPNVQDLFLPNTTGLGTFQDPCGVSVPGAADQTASLAACMNTGMTAAQYGTTTNCPAAQCSARFGGGAVTGLKPEDANTYSVGVVLQPRFFPGFSASVDYFNIKVNNVISAGVAAPQTILTSCLASASSPFCALIHRDSTGGLASSEGYVFQTNANAGFIATDGIDLAANYRLGLPHWMHGSSAGSLNFAFVGTWTDHQTAQPTKGGGTYDCAGLYGPTCGAQFGSAGVSPKFKSQLRTTWNTPWNMQVSLNWRYLTGVNLDALSTNPLLNSLAVDTIEGHLPAYSYFDLTANWKVKDGLVLRAGVNNLFDRDPPVVDAINIPIAGPPYGNGNTFPGVYDSLGRNVFVGLTANF